MKLGDLLDKRIEIVPAHGGPDVWATLVGVEASGIWIKYTVLDSIGTPDPGGDQRLSFWPFSAIREIIPV